MSLSTHLPSAYPSDLSTHLSFAFHQPTGFYISLWAYMFVDPAFAGPLAQGRYEKTGDGILVVLFLPPYPHQGPRGPKVLGSMIGMALLGSLFADFLVMDFRLDL